MSQGSFVKSQFAITLGNVNDHILPSARANTQSKSISIHYFNAIYLLAYKDRIQNKGMELFLIFLYRYDWQIKGNGAT